MNTKIRKFGDDSSEFETVDHSPHECAFCKHVSERGIRFHDAHDRHGKDEAIVFLENDAGQVHRISARRMGATVMLHGAQVTPEEARAEIAAKS